jgi:predicted PurR-regulated permease PerM
MDPLALVFLGVIALSSLVQAAFLVGLARAGMDLAKQVSAWEDRFEREIRPAIANVTQVAENLSQITDGVLRQIPEIEAVVQETSQSVRRLGQAVDRFVLRPLAPVTATAFLIAAARRALGRRSSERVH